MLISRGAKQEEEQSLGGEEMQRKVMVRRMPGSRGSRFKTRKPNRKNNRALRKGTPWNAPVTTVDTASNASKIVTEKVIFK